MMGNTRMIKGFGYIPVLFGLPWELLVSIILQISSTESVKNLICETHNETRPSL